MVNGQVPLLMFCFSLLISLLLEVLNHKHSPCVYMMVYPWPVQYCSSYFYDNMLVYLYDKLTVRNSCVYISTSKCSEYINTTLFFVNIICNTILIIIIFKASYSTLPTLLFSKLIL